jgi:hypothetical protein
VREEQNLETGSGISLDRVVVSASLVRCQGAGISEIVLYLTDLEVVRTVEYVQESQVVGSNVI